MAISSTFVTGQVFTAADANLMANSGLVYITTGTATSGTTLNITSCFSSTYDNYRLLLSGYKAASASGFVLQLGTGSALTTNYYWCGAYCSSYTAAPTLIGYGGSNVAYVDVAIVGDANNAGAGNIEIYSPNMAQRTGFIVGGLDARSSAANPRIAISGFQDTNTQFTSLHITSTQTITNLVATLYGYRKA